MTDVVAAVLSGFSPGFCRREWSQTFAPHRLRREGFQTFRPTEYAAARSPNGDARQRGAQRGSRAPTAA